MGKPIFFITDEYRIEISAKDNKTLNLMYRDKNDKDNPMKLNSYTELNYNEILDDYEEIKNIHRPSRPKKPRMGKFTNDEERIIAEEKFNKDKEKYDRVFDRYTKLMKVYKKNRKEIKSIFAELGYTI